MGNAINYPTYKIEPLLTPPTPALHCLVKCNCKLGKFTEISGFLTKSLKKLIRTTTDKHNFRKLTQNTQIDGKEELIFSAFANSKKQINLFELFGAIIIYSACSWEQKCEIALQLFDSDKDEVITKEEMNNMCVSFIKSIGTMARIPLWKYVSMAKLMDQCWLAAEEHPNGLITHFELKDWVKQNTVILKLLQQFKPKKPKKCSLEPLRNLSFASTQHSSFTEKKALKKLKRPNPSVSELLEIFLKLKSLRKRPTVARIFQEFLKSQNFVNDANYLYNIFHYNLNNELTIEELVEILNNSPKKPVFVKRRNLSTKSEIKIEAVEEPSKKEEMGAKVAARLENVFDQFDLNHDGTVDLFELEEGLKEGLDKKIIDGLFKRYVKKGRNSLGIKEFIEMFAPAYTEVTSESLRHVQYRIDSNIKINNL